MPVVASQQVRYKPDVLIQELSGESVLLNLATETYFGLDAVGTRMMQLLQEKNSVTAAVDQLVEEYEIDRPTLQRDLLDLVDQCATQGLVEISGT